MSDQSSDQTSDPLVPSGADRSGDFGYDEAHASGDDEQRTSVAGHRPPVYVATTTPDAGGDYSYDLAHDVPPAPPPTTR